MTTHRIHLLYEPWDRMEFLGAHIKMPQAFGYGHVYCVLERDGDVVKKDLYGLTEDHVDRSEVKAGLRGLFQRAMRGARLEVYTEDKILFLADEDEPIASFNITAEHYEHALKRFNDLHGTVIDYDRLIHNCVHNAAADLRAAGVNAGSGFGYTAGRFFKKMHAQSEGNLLAPPLRVAVIERCIPK